VKNKHLDTRGRRASVSILRERDKQSQRKAWIKIFKLELFNEIQENVDRVSIEIVYPK